MAFLDVSSPHCIFVSICNRFKKFFRKNFFWEAEKMRHDWVEGGMGDGGGIEP